MRLHSMNRFLIVGGASNDLMGLTGALRKLRTSSTLNMCICWRLLLGRAWKYGWRNLKSASPFKMKGLIMVEKNSGPMPQLLTRRELLHACGMGLGTLAFAQLFGQSALADDKAFANPLAAKPPHFTP